MEGSVTNHIIMYASNGPYVWLTYGAVIYIVLITILMAISLSNCLYRYYIKPLNRFNDCFGYKVILLLGGIFNLADDTTKRLRYPFYISWSIVYAILLIGMLIWPLVACGTVMTLFSLIYGNILYLIIKLRRNVYDNTIMSKYIEERRSKHQS